GLIWAPAHTARCAAPRDFQARQPDGTTRSLPAWRKATAIAAHRRMPLTATTTPTTTVTSSILSPAHWAIAGAPAITWESASTTAISGGITIRANGPTRPIP